MNESAPALQEAPKTCDVLVIGGGPAGTTAGSLLREMGYHVVLLEKCHHPRFHIGESLLPANLPLFEKLGVAKQVEAIGMPTRPADFVSPWHDHRQEFRFADGWNKSLPSAYQVERSKFDFVLLKNARDKGVEVVEGCEVQSVDLDRSDGMAEVRARSDTGQSTVWRTRFVADASGRSTFLSNKLQLKERSKNHNSVALYAHFVGAERGQGAAEGNISLFWFDHGWFWFIPLRGGATSVGMVTWPYFVKTRGERTLSDFFKDSIASCPPLAARLKQAHRVIDVTATGNFSYSSSRAYGKNYLLLGDAYAFVDPMFSSGVWLAMNSGDQAAATIETCFKQPAKAVAALRAFDRMMRKGPREYSWFIHRITHPTLREMFMYPSEKLRMKEALLSLLAGDIFGATPIWRSIALFKSAYYLVSVRNLGRTYPAWKQRRFNIRRDRAVEASVTSV
jgi:flavin-dependent dehydrogenase